MIKEWRSKKMPITTWLCRGDTHGNFHWMSQQLSNYEPEKTAIIILGDSGINFYLNKTDARQKKEIEQKGYYLYLVRGNHECRPQHLPEMHRMHDENVNGPVYYEPDYPHIRYFKDYGIYDINGYRCLVIGGAYSVDKWWRLARAGITDPGMNIPKKTGWFADECLSEIEMADCEKMIDNSQDYVFDFVLTHTCPKKFQPTDLFLGAIDQSKVDDSMEVWMDKIYSKIVINFAWIFGHYHRDRIERPHIEQYFNDIEELDNIANRWIDYDKTGQLDWWLNKSPFFNKSESID